MYDPIIFAVRKLQSPEELRCPNCTARAAVTCQMFDVQLGLFRDSVMKFACLHVRVPCKEMRQLLR